MELPNSYKKIPAEVIQEIIRMYEETGSANKVGAFYNVGATKIIRLLNRNGVSTEKKSENISKNRIVYKIDIDYFSRIDTANKAYILGVLFSDEHMYSARKQVRLKLTDLELMIKIREELKYDKPFNKNKKEKENHKEAYSLIVCNIKIYDDLIALGCIKNKSYNLRFPKLEPQFIPHFIRGFFDGNGCIYVGIDKRSDRLLAELVIVSTNEFCKSIIDYLASKDIHSDFFRDKKHDSRIGKMRIRRQEDLIKMFDLLYSEKDQTIFLERKYNKYFEFLNDKKLI